LDGSDHAGLLALIDKIRARAAQKLGTVPRVVSCSLALIKMDFGIDKPSNFAVRALTTSSWVVGSSMGMSPGLVPFRNVVCQRLGQSKQGLRIPALDRSKMP
jgi:hypothetical protein